MQQEEIKVAAGEKRGTTGEVHLPSFLAKAVVDVVSNNLNKRSERKMLLPAYEKGDIGSSPRQSVGGKRLMWKTS